MSGKVREALELALELNKQNGGWSHHRQLFIDAIEELNKSNDASFEAIPLSGSLISVDEAMNLVRAICETAGDWIKYESGCDIDCGMAAKKEIRRAAVALIAKYDARRDAEIKESCDRVRKAFKLQEGIQSHDGVELICKAIMEGKA